MLLDEDYGWQSYRDHFCVSFHPLSMVMEIMNPNENNFSSRATAIFYCLFL